MIHSVLSGLLLLVLALWVRLLWVDLQQRWLWRRAGAALERARARGYRLRPRGLRCRLVAEGGDPSLPRRLVWATGLAGPHLRVDGRVLPLACTAEELEAALSDPPGPKLSADGGQLPGGLA